MRAERILQAGLIVLWTACAWPIANAQTQAMRVVPIEATRFMPVNPASPNGPQIAVLGGDPDAGPSTMLMRMQKGGGTPHVHSADYQLVVLQGTMKHWGKGQTEAASKPLNHGSHWFQPGGKTHSDMCLTNECLLYIVWSGKRDGRVATESDP